MGSNPTADTSFWFFFFWFVSCGGVVLTHVYKQKKALFYFFLSCLFGSALTVPRIFFFLRALLRHFPCIVLSTELLYSLANNAAPSLKVFSMRIAGGLDLGHRRRKFLLSRNEVPSSGADSQLESLYAYRYGLREAPIPCSTPCVPVLCAISCVPRTPALLYVPCIC